jgi:surface protein
MNKRNLFKSRFLRAALMLTLAVMTFPIEAWAEKIPYAVLSDEGKTLTFKYEEHTVSGENEWDVSNTAGELGIDDPEWSGHFNSITTVVFDESFAGARPKSCYYWFYHFSWLTTITGLNYLNTSEVTNMENMFNDCSSLTSLDLSSFNTSKVTNMSGMFRDCSDLTSLAIGSGFTVHEYGDGNIEGKTKTDKMFYGCNALADGMLIVNGIGSAGDNNLKPSIAQNIFEGVFTNGTLATNLTAEQLGASEPDGDGLYTWKGGKFKSVGKVKIPYIDENGKLHYDDGTDTPTDTSDDFADALPITSANGNVSYGAGWYFVAGNVTINGQLRFTGDAHIILCDGAKMTVTNTNNHAIYGSDASLAIYGQSTGNGMGSLTATASGNFSGIYAFSVKGGNSSVTINGGHVTATASGNFSGISAFSVEGGNSSVTINGGHVTATASGNFSGIYAFSVEGGNSSVTINGGHVTATGGTNGCGIEAASSGGGNSSVTINGGHVTATGGYSGIKAYSSLSPSTDSGDSSVTINGGQVNATGGTSGSGIESHSTNGDANITLGWTKADDYICANSYSLIGWTAENMNIAAGKRFVAYNMASDDDISANCIIGDASSNTATAIDTDISLTDATAAKTIAGKTLRPLNGYTVSTTDPNIILKDGTTAKTADFTITGTGSNAVTTSYYIYKASTTEAPVSVTLGFSGEVPTGYAPVYTATKNIDGTDVTSTVISGSTLTMPAYDVTITATTVLSVATVTVGSGTSAVTEAFVSGIHAPSGVTNKTDAAALQAAVNYAQNLYVAAEGNTPATVATVTLSKDVSFGSDNDLLTIGDGSTATAVKLDLNGKTLSSTMENNCVVFVKACAELTIIGNGTSTICNTGELGYAINNNGTLNVSGGNISGTQIAISNSGMLTVSGGTISATIEDGYGIENASTLTLHALDVFGNNGADIWLGTGKKIGFGSGTYSIPEKKIKVVSYVDNALPYTFTSGYSTYVKSGNDIIDPDDVFDNSDKIILFGGEAQLMAANAIYVKYIDANGKLHDDLDGSTETTDDDGAAALPITSANNGATYDGGWYYASGNVTIDGTLEFTGDAHIILCDGVKMTATTNTDADAISATNLNIYGQSNSTGTLTVNSSITAKSISAPGVTVIAKDKDATKNITANGDVTAGSLIATKLTATNHNLTLTGTGSEIGTTDLGMGTLTVNDNAGGSVGKLTAGTVNVNKGGKLTATSVTSLSSLTVTGGKLSLGGNSTQNGNSNLSEVTSVTLKEGGVIRTNGGVLKVGNVSGAGTIQGKDGIVLATSIDNPNLNIVAETKNITATDNNVTNIKAKSLTATDGGIIATGKDITAETISAKGTVTAGNIKAVSGGNGSSGYMIFGWNAPDNFIQASSYEGTVKIADGQYFTYEGNTGGLLSGTLTADQVTAIAGKKLTPVSDKITVPARQYMTYFSTDALTLGTEQTDAALYTITSVGTDAVTLSDALSVASKGTPLLVYNSATTEKDIVLYITAEPATATAHADEFMGTPTAKTFNADDMEDKQCYVLAGGKMFVPVSGAGTIAAHRCWLELNNPSAARSLVIIGNELTSISEELRVKSEEFAAAQWYSLDGRKLDKQPTKKGVYIMGGRKVVIK